MDRQELILLGSQIMAIDNLTRWEFDPLDEKQQDYFHQQIIDLMWKLFVKQLQKISGVSSDITYYLEEAIWEGCPKPDFKKLLNDGIESANKYSIFDASGEKIVDFYKGYIELIVDNAIKIGALLKQNQRYIKNQG